MTEIEYALNTFYFLMAGALVMWMAAGFTMLEAGFVRRRNTAEIVTKNIGLYSIACFMFLLCGYKVMYPGESFAGAIFSTYDFSFGLNFAFPWAYIAVTNSLSFNDYKKEDSSVDSGRLRSDVTNTFDVMLTKALGDFFPAIDPNRSFFINLSYEKVISEANILNYDYISDSFSLSFARSFSLN